MSESTGGEMTFSQPTSPTTGLQPYDLERRPKRLYQATARRLASQHRRKRHMRKDSPMNDTIDAMVLTLAKSVSEITTAGPENRDALLTKTFGEFKEALAPELEKMVDDSQPEAIEGISDEPLYKGLGTVGRVANLLGTIANQVEAIKAGRDQYAPVSSSGDDDDVDPASDEVAEVLDHVVAMAEIALRACVNEHVDIADDDDTPDTVEKGESLVLVPNAEAPDDEASAFLVKTSLPEGLAKMATDPGAIAMQTMEHAAAMMLRCGVPQESLAKMFGGEGNKLAKGMPPGVDPDADPDAPAATDDGTDPMDPSQDDGSQDDGSQDDPMDVLGRLLAAAMIQLDHIQTMIAGGGADDAAPPPPAEDPADGPAPKADPSDEPDPKPPVAKADFVPPEAAAYISELEKVNGTLEAELAKVLASPAAPKGAVRVPGNLEKSSDGVMGGESELAKFADQLDNAKTPEDRALLLTKASYKFPGVDFSKLAKVS